MNRLLDIGFRKVGCWSAIENGLTFTLSELSKARNILYAFISDEVVLYVGKTTQPLKSRLGWYVKPGSSQRTNIRVNKNIMGLLAEGKQLEIFALQNDSPSLGHFLVNLAAGLEDSIIKTLKPAWNEMGMTDRHT